MRRTELIPSATDATALTTGTLYYHFSMKREDTNAPSTAREHQIAFFESHFTELKYGLAAGGSGAGDTTLRWMAASTEQWSATLDAGVWHNFAYEIDFAASTVGFWHSTGGDALTQVVAPVAASVSSNGADWHVGVLELPVDGVADTDEDLYFSGVWIESGELTTTFGAGTGSTDTTPAVESSAPAGSSAPVASSVAPSSSVAPTTGGVKVPAVTPSVVQSSVAPTSTSPVTPTALPSTATKCTTTKTVWVTPVASSY